MGHMKTEERTITNIVAATLGYEQWLSRHARIVINDLRLKHERMRESPFVFLRATFYRWLQLWPKLCPREADAHAVHSVGDVHTENFGTWRDAEGRLAWGINDVDEACVLPYTNDLVRLAASVLFAIRERWLAISDARACQAVLEGYTRCLAEGGQAIVLAERHVWLRDIAVAELRDPWQFWQKLERLRPLGAARLRAAPHTLFRASLPDRAVRYTVARRVAGVGSLGRARFVAIADWNGAQIAREAKAAVPSAAAFAGTGRVRANDAVRLLATSVRAADPFLTIRDGWLVRRLAPDCTRIEIGDLPRWRDEKNLLRAMGWEIGNVHVGGGRTRILADLDRRPRQWLRRAAEAMAAATYDDWLAWRRET
jgi:hypothetical protein